MPCPSWSPPCGAESNKPSSAPVPRPLRRWAGSGDRDRPAWASLAGCEPGLPPARWPRERISSPGRPSCRAGLVGAGPPAQRRPCRATCNRVKPGRRCSAGTAPCGRAVVSSASLIVEVPDDVGQRSAGIRGVVHEQNVRGCHSHDLQRAYVALSRPAGAADFSSLSPLVGSRPKDLPLPKAIEQYRRQRQGLVRGRG